MILQVMESHLDSGATTPRDQDCLSPDQDTPTPTATPTHDREKVTAKRMLTTEYNVTYWSLQTPPESMNSSQANEEDPASKTNDVQFLRLQLKEVHWDFERFFMWKMTVSLLLIVQNIESKLGFQAALINTMVGASTIIHFECILSHIFIILFLVSITYF